MTAQELLELVSKMLSLSRIPGEDDTEETARRVRERVQLWNISASELERGEIASDIIRTGRLYFHSWERRLLLSIADATFCVVLTFKYLPATDDLFGSRGKREAIYEIVGREPNRKAAIELYRYMRDAGLVLANEIMRQKRNGGLTKKQLLDGYVWKIAKALQNANKDWSGYQDVEDLYLTEERANDDWISAKYGDLPKEWVMLPPLMEVSR